MSWKGHLVLDADSHVYERADVTYRDYIDPDFREPYDLLCRAIKRQADSGQRYALFETRDAVVEPFDGGLPLGVHQTFGLTPQGGGGSPRPQTSLSPRGGEGEGEGTGTESGDHVPPLEVNWDPGARSQAMDRAGIDINVIFPTHASSYCAFRDARFESALYRAYHRFISAYCAQLPARMKWIVLANLRDIPAAIEEVTHWAERDGNTVGVYLPPMAVGRRHLDCPDFHPLYQRVQDLDVPLVVHIGVSRPPYMPGTLDLDGRAFLIRALTPGWAGMAAMGALIGGGVFDRFPRLRVGLFEMHASWMPFAVEQFTIGARRSPAHVPYLRTSVREVIASGRYFHGIETGEEGLKYAVQEFGDDIWLFTTDFPHRGSPWPNGVQEAVEPPWMTEQAKRKLLGQNALRLYTRIREP